MSFGLLAVCFQYGLYVVVHMSKFGSLYSVFTWSMSTVPFRYTLVANVLRLDDGQDLQHQSSIEDLHLHVLQNCHSKHSTRHYPNPQFAIFGFLSSRLFPKYNYQSCNNYNSKNYQNWND